MGKEVELDVEAADELGKKFGADADSLRIYGGLLRFSRSDELSGGTTPRRS